MLNLIGFISIFLSFSYLIFINKRVGIITLAIYLIVITLFFPIELIGNYAFITVIGLWLLSKFFKKGIES